MEQKTPLINRVIFGIITLLFILTMLKMVYAYTNGADTPPFPLWILFFGLPLIGLLLITIKGDIRLRLHRIWTPIGLMIIAVAWFVIIFVNFKSGILYTLFVNGSESLFYANALGLLLAFVDLDVLYKYAYFFIPSMIFTIAGIAHDDIVLLTHPSLEWNGFIDQIWFASGFLFAYYAVKKFRAEHPKLKRVLLFSGAFAASIILFVVVGAVLAGFFPSNSWVAHWLTAQKPLINLVCIGGSCNSSLYSNIYSTNSTLCLELNSSFRSGVSSFSVIAQDHSFLLCRFLMNTDTNVLTVSCPNNITMGIGNTINFTMGPCSSFSSAKKIV